MTDPLADLQRRAYARPDDSAGALAAQAELARLADEQRRVERGTAIDLPPVAHHAVSGTRVQLLLGALVVLVTVAAGSSVLAHATSLDVFDRAQVATDIPQQDFPRPVIESSVRLLGSSGTVDAYGALTEDGYVCLTADYGIGTGTSCSLLADFRATGIDLQLFLGAYMEGVLVVVSWGPDGPAVIDAR